MKNKKMLSEANIRKLIAIILGVKNNADTALDKCVLPYDDAKVYSKDDICFFNGSLYRAKTVTNGNEPSPESTYFEMLDGVEEEIDAQYIETLMSTVSAETFDYMKNFINDDIISGTHGYSSAKIYAEIQNAIQTAKDYTLEKVANSSTGSYVIATGTDEVVDDKHLFLISNGSNYDIYALVNGAPTKIGDTSVSLDGLLTEANAESTYLKQTDATATYTTITTTDGLRTDLDNHKNNAVAHLTQEERDKLVTTDVLGDYAKTVDLPTPRTDDEIKTLADGQIESSKQVLQFSDLKGITADSTLDEVVRAVPGHKIAILQSASFTNYLGLPHQMYTITINSLGYNRMQVFATSKYSDHASYVGACDNSSGVDVYDKWIKVITDKHVTTTIDSSSTDTQVPSAKSVYTIVSDVKFCNPNLLDNPFFTVNQRGKTSYTGNGYTVDRWKIYNTDGLTVTINSDRSLTITNTATSGNRYFGQIFNLDLANKLKGRRVTLSIDGYSTSGKAYMYSHYRSDKGNANIKVYGNSTIKTERAIYNGACEFPDFDVNYCEIFNLFIQPGESVTIYSAKVEVGEVSTLKNEEVPDYNEELLRCQISTADSSDTYANRHIYTTRVADVPWTPLTMGSGMNGSMQYRVKNGICYVQVNALKSSTMSTSGQTITSGLPIPELTANVWYSLTANSITDGGILISIDGTGKMTNHVGSNSATYYGYFSYPVAES